MYALQQRHVLSSAISRQATLCLETSAALQQLALLRYDVLVIQTCAPFFLTVPGIFRLLME